LRAGSLGTFELIAEHTSIVGSREVILEVGEKRLEFCESFAADPYLAVNHCSAVESRYVDAISTFSSLSSILRTYVRTLRMQRVTAIKDKSFPVKTGGLLTLADILMWRAGLSSLRLDRAR
jgi:hypothetical protein